MIRYWSFVILEVIANAYRLTSDNRKLKTAIKLFENSKKMTNLRLVIIFLDEAAQIIYLFPFDNSKSFLVPDNKGLDTTFSG